MTRNRSTITIALVSTAVLVTCYAGAAQPPATSHACTAPEYRQFDFWIGDWDVFEADSAERVARVRVDSILDGCVLHELYDDPSGLKGESLTIYDASRRLWHQSWTTNHGQLLVIEGRVHGAEIVMTGSSRAASGEEKRVRATWKPIGGGTVRETAIASTDAGKTWKPWFDLWFRPHAKDVSAMKDAPAAEDARIVAALDKQYQAAVKANDVFTMDGILADDFILVTGSGKVFKKADLLEEASTGKFAYEHQDETEQTVRVWSDTAIVTAKLWIKGTRDGKLVDYTLWFSDTYVRTSHGWRYVFGQSSLPLPNTP